MDGAGDAPGAARGTRQAVETTTARRHKTALVTCRESLHDCPRARPVRAPTARLAWWAQPWAAVWASQGVCAVYIWAISVCIRRLRLKASRVPGLLLAANMLA